MSNAMGEHARRSRLVFAGLCVLALLTLVLAYANSLRNSFQFDDGHVIEQNVYIRSLSNVPLFFRDASTFSALPANATYRPLVSTTLALDYWLGGGLDVRQFHISQLVMLVLLGVLVYGLARRIFDHAGEHPGNRLAALLAASLFALHTTNTETMNAIAARSELLSTMGVVGAFLVYFHLPRSRRFHLYLLPMVIGALAKSPAVMFAPLFLVYLLLFEERLSLRDLFTRTAWPSAWSAVRRSLPALIVGAITFVAVESQNAAAATYGGGSRLDYLLTQSFVWLHYGRLFFLPVGLTADSDWRLIERWYDTRVLAGVLFIFLLVRLVWVCSRTAGGRPVAFGIAWFALALLPASSIFPLAEVTNEHRVFFPYIGASLAVVWGAVLLLDKVRATRPRLGPALARMAWPAAFVVLGCHAVGVHERNKVWLSAETLWRDVVEKSPANGRGLMNYGLSQMEQGKYAEAKQYFERALQYNPNYATLEINLGIASGALHDSAAAERHFQRALDLQPEYYASHYFYGRWLADRGDTVAALEQLERALALSPADINTRYLLLDIYARTGRTSEVTRLAEDTLRLAPGDARAQRVLSDAAAAPGPPDESLSGPSADQLLTDSLRLYQAGDFQGCIDAARRLLELKSDSAEAYNNIAAAHASLEQWDEAIEAARASLRLKPDYQLARNNLNWAEAEKQKATGGGK